MKLSAISALCIGMGALALSGGGGAYWYLQHAVTAETIAPALLAKKVDLSLGDDWHSVDNYIKIQQAAASEEETADDSTKRAERQADLRRRLQPPLLPLHLVADYQEKTSPKSHWGDGARTVAATAPLTVTQSTDGAEIPKADSLVSNHAQETIATLEAFRTALRSTGGEKKFPAGAGAETGSGKLAAASPYIDR